jgi:hypothetical protein
MSSLQVIQNLHYEEYRLFIQKMLLKELQNNNNENVEKYKAVIKQVDKWYADDPTRFSLPLSNYFTKDTDGNADDKDATEDATGAESAATTGSAMPVETSSSISSSAPNNKTLQAEIKQLRHEKVERVQQQQKMQAEQEKELLLTKKMQAEQEKELLMLRITMEAQQEQKEKELLILTQQLKESQEQQHVLVEKSKMVLSQFLLTPSMSRLKEVGAAAADVGNNIDSGDVEEARNFYTALDDVERKRFDRLVAEEDARKEKALRIDWDALIIDTATELVRRVTQRAINCIDFLITLRPFLNGKLTELDRNTIGNPFEKAPKNDDDLLLWLHHNLWYRPRPAGDVYTLTIESAAINIAVDIDASVSVLQGVAVGTVSSISGVIGSTKFDNNVRVVVIKANKGGFNASIELRIGTHVVKPTSILSARHGVSSIGWLTNYHSYFEMFVLKLNQAVNGSVLKYAQEGKEVASEVLTTSPEEDCKDVSKILPWLETVGKLVTTETNLIGLSVAKALQNRGALDFANLRNMSTLIVLLKHFTMAKRSNFNDPIILKFHATIKAGNMLDVVEDILSNNSNNDECAAKLLPYFYIDPAYKNLILNQYREKAHPLSDVVKMGWANASKIVGMKYDEYGRRASNARSKCLYSAFCMLVSHCSISMPKFSQYCLNKINDSESTGDESIEMSESGLELLRSVLEYQIVDDPSINVGQKVQICVQIAGKDEWKRVTIDTKNRDGTCTVKYDKKQKGFNSIGTVTSLPLNSKAARNTNKFNVKKNKLRKDDGSAFNDSDRSVLYTLNFSGRIGKVMGGKQEFGKLSVNGGFQPIFNKATNAPNRQ